MAMRLGADTWFERLVLLALPWQDYIQLANQEERDNAHFFVALCLREVG